MIFKLSKPLKTQMGQVYTELNLDLDSLTGEDSESVEREVAAEVNPILASFDFSRSYNVRMAARACGVNFFELKKLSYKDFNRLAAEVANFSPALDSGEAKATQEPEIKTIPNPAAKSAEK